MPTYDSLDAQTVLVGMSGGVDSTVTACLLRAQGWHVIGVTMQVWDGSVPLPDTGRSGCFGPGEVRELEEIRALARQLDFEHVTLNLAKQYARSVLDYFRAEYLCGKTPNPCVVCNHTMKFGALIEAARAQGIAFDYFATGHYARIGFDAARGRYLLRRGIDSTKDQSYFLSQLTQEQLRQVLCPLGEMTKTAVKAKAIEFGLPQLAARPESQDFIESDNYAALFAGRAIEPGPIFDTHGVELGRHCGIVYYTIGQRKGLGIGGGTGEPYYVVAIDACRNAVIVGRHAEVKTCALEAAALNWIALAAPTAPFRATVRIRQQHTPAPAWVTPLDGTRAHVVFDEPQLAITPGQVVVLYDDEVVLAGGFIM
jgi:tRNA-specific 2-thiouridylase